MEEVKLLGIDLSIASELVIEILIEDTTEPQIFKNILEANRGRPEILKILAQSPYVQEEIRHEASQALNLPAASEEVAARSYDRSEHAEEVRKQSLFTKIQTLSIGEKIHLALMGGRDIRSLLSRDSNKEIVLTVLKNPKITDTEVELFARSRNAPDDVLRNISKSREWMKNYAIVTALVNNPKTPPGISSQLVYTLKAKDLVSLEYNKNVPEGIRALAKKMLQAKRKG